MNGGQSWPGGKRLAVLVSVLLESWGEGKSPSYFTRTTPLKPGVTDHAGIQWSRFGGREGIWRILRILGDSGLHATICANALSAELYPEAIRAALRAGHDIAAHGYSQDQYLSDMTAEGQRATIRKSLDIIERVAGKRPDGWVSAVYGWTPETHELLVQEGLRWHADALDTTMPRLEKKPSGTIVALPWCDFVDNRVLRASPRDYYDVYKDSFDYLHAQEPMALLHLAVHSHFGGRPLIAATLAKLLRYFREFPDVWFPRHAELAEWWRERKLDELSYAQRFFGAGAAE